jgi:hypothetical protein
MRKQFMLQRQVKGLGARQLLFPDFPDAALVLRSAQGAETLHEARLHHDEPAQQSLLSAVRPHDRDLIIPVQSSAPRRDYNH